MDLNKFMRDKNIAIASFAVFSLIALYLFINDTKIFLLVTALLACIAIYLINRKTKKEKPVSQTQQKEEFKHSSCFPISSSLRLSDVAGLDEAKEELFEIKDFLKNPDKYKKFSARIPKGLLLVGPPGVGKTMIAKALAGEAEVPFFYQSGSSFVEIYVGMGAKKVHELFETAKKSSPSIIFIDEIDSVGKARGGMRSDEREATLNQLLTEMDGFESNSGVIVIAATNRIEMLDDALLRAGRFDRHVHLDLPSVKERESILNIYLNKRPHALDIEKLAFITSGFSGAGLENFINEASLNAIKLEKEKIDMDDFMAVKDKVVFGKKQQVIFNLQEKERVALYQAAKAITARKLGLEFEKITLFLNSFLSKSSSMQSQKTYMHKAAAQISGVVAYDLLYKERYSNMKEDILLTKALIDEYIENFNIEKNISYTDLLEQAKDIAARSIKESSDEIESLQKRLLNQEIVYFNEL